MSEPRWKHLFQQLLDRHAHLPHARFVSAATVRADGRPANRTLTFRLLLEDGRLAFTTDSRSEKPAQLATNPWMELCWYFTEARTQLRLLGQASVPPPETAGLLELRMQTWRGRTEQSRQAFSWPAPGQPLAAAEDFELPCPQLPPDNFLLLLFAPRQVEVLELTPHPHRRHLHTLQAGTWNEAAVNP